MRAAPPPRDPPGKTVLRGKILPQRLLRLFLNRINRFVAHEFSSYFMVTIRFLNLQVHNSNRFMERVFFSRFVRAARGRRVMAQRRHIFA